MAWYLSSALMYAAGIGALTASGASYGWAFVAFLTIASGAKLEFRAARR